MTSEMRVEQRAELVAFPAVEGDDFEPDALSELLGITPTRIYRRGEVGSNGRVRPYSLWMWETPERVEHDSEVLIHEVLDTFEPLAGQLSQARSDWGLEFQIGLAISMHGSIEVDPDGTLDAVVSTQALYLSPETLRRLTALGCALDVDTHVIAPE